MTWAASAAEGVGIRAVACWGCSREVEPEVVGRAALVFGFATETWR